MERCRGYGEVMLIPLILVFNIVSLLQKIGTTAGMITVGTERHTNLDSLSIGYFNAHGTICVC